VAQKYELHSCDEKRKAFGKGGLLFGIPKNEPLAHDLGSEAQFFS
jgi:hypothetical protein